MVSPAAPPVADVAPACRTLTAITHAIERLTIRELAALNAAARTDADTRDQAMTRAAELARLSGRAAVLDCAMEQVRRAAHGAPVPAVEVLTHGVTAMILADLLEPQDQRLLLEPISAAIQMILRWQRQGRHGGLARNRLTVIWNAQESVQPVAARSLQAKT